MQKLNPNSEGKSMAEPRRPHVGLALGSGSARGWAHIRGHPRWNRRAFARTWCVEHPSARSSAPPTRRASWIALNNGCWDWGSRTSWRSWT